MSLTPTQVTLIRSTVPVLRAHGLAITTLFYSQILSDHPSLNAVFNHANQVSGHQQKALAGSLAAYAAHIDDLGRLGPAVERISNKHASLGVAPAHYDVVGVYLLRAMGEVLGEALTPDVRDAWTAAYRQLAEIMIRREGELVMHAGEWTGWRDFTIREKVNDGEDMVGLVLAPSDGKALPAFAKGQFVSLQTQTAAFEYAQSKQYMLVGEASPDVYRISVKRERGLDVTSPAAAAHAGFVAGILCEEKEVGDLVRLSHPFGGR